MCESASADEGLAHEEVFERLAPRSDCDDPRSVRTRFVDDRVGDGVSFDGEDRVGAHGIDAQGFRLERSPQRVRGVGDLDFNVASVGAQEVRELSVRAHLPAVDDGDAIAEHLDVGLHEVDTTYPPQ